MKAKMFLLLAWMFPFLLTAQQNPQKPPREKLIEKKIAFMRQRTVMNDQEFKSAEPLMRDYEMKRWRLFDKRRKILGSLKDDRMAQLSDAEVAGKLDELMKIDEQLYRLRSDYYLKMRKILPPRKMLQFMRAEMAFKRRLLKAKRKKTLEKRKARINRVHRSGAPARR